jgi:phosphate transporter
MSEVVDKAFPFESTTQERLTDGIQSLVPLYAAIATGGDEDAALKQLKAQLREHIVWERNTVWREMIGLERKGWGAGGGRRAGVDVPIVEGQNGTAKTELVTPVGRFFLPSWLSGSVIAGTFAVLLFLFILSGDWFDRAEEQNCLALLAFVTIFWALEVRSFSTTSAFFSLFEY